MKTELWNGHEIRFIEKDGEWWAVLGDIAKALGLRAKKLRERLEDDALNRGLIPDNIGRTQEMLLVNELGIYDAVLRSSKPEAKAFKRWVFGVIKSLRVATGLEGFEVFRMLDKQHQREAMANLSHGLRTPVRVDFIKANTIADKAVSTMHGFPKMLKKGQMAPQMLVDRQPILDDTVELMQAKDKFNLGISVSAAIYTRHLRQKND